MVVTNGSVQGETKTGRGRNVWTLLCRAALRSADWAAATWGVRDAEDCVEHCELSCPRGIAPGWPGAAVPRRVDWAKLDTFERGRLARALTRERA
jgi:hypothetical protein